jgi:hypothetical protein
MLHDIFHSRRGFDPGLGLIGNGKPKGMSQPFITTKTVSGLAMICVFTVAVAVSLKPTASSGVGFQSTEPIRQVFESNAPESVYAADPNDSWNRIFRLLFTRTIKTDMSSDFPEAGPFVSAEAMSVPGLRVSTRRFERMEIGDRAIEPLYPSFLDIGISEARYVLTEPHYSEFKQALSEALKEPKARPPIARALMQSDVWAAYDVLFATYGGGGKSEQILLSLLAQFVRKLALSEPELRALPNNYSAAIKSHNLPNLFSPDGGWIEIQLLPNRWHDHAANYRRASRVFVKPLQMPLDRAAFVETLKHNQLIDQLEAVALVVQNLLIDTSGKVVPSPIYSDLQIRRFANNKKGKAEASEYELSRRLLLTDPASGGFVESDDMAPAYLATAGNDLGFATPMRSTDVPVLAALRTRCAQCHDSTLTHQMTFSIHDFPPVPLVTVLVSTQNDRALYVAKRKEQRTDYKSLLLQK